MAEGYHVVPFYFIPLFRSGLCGGLPGECGIVRAHAETVIRESEIFGNRLIEADRFARGVVDDILLHQEALAALIEENAVVRRAAMGIRAPWTLCSMPRSTVPGW